MIFPHGKKGQIASPLSTAMLTLLAFLVLIIAVSIGGKVLTDIEEQEKISATAINESGIQSANSSLIQLAHNYDVTGTTNAIVICNTVCGATGNVVNRLPANWSLSETGGFNMSINTIYNSSSINITYTYQYGSVAGNASAAGSSGIDNVSGQFGALGTIIGLTLVIGVLFGFVALYISRR